jgi:DNA-binding GntR family transcriptional regulator
VPTEQGATTKPLTRLALPTSQGDQVLRAITAAIQDGVLAPGSLHSAKSLSEQLGVSRTPVREALLQLAHDGVVRFERNRGVRITQSSVRDLEEIFEIRMWLELPAVRLAALRRTNHQLELLERGLTVLSGDIEAMSDQELRRQDHNFHVTLMEITGNARLAQYVDTLRASVLMHDAMSSEHGQLHTRVVDEHLPILGAIRRKDPDAAEEAMASHLKETAHTLITAARRRGT